MTRAVRIVWWLWALALALIPLLLFVGCASPRPEPTKISSKLEAQISTAQAAAVITPPMPPRRFVLAWDNPNPVWVQPFLFTEFHSASNVSGPFMFKALIPPGTNSWEFQADQPQEFFICRFLNIWTGEYSTWNQ